MQKQVFFFRPIEYLNRHFPPQQNKLYPIVSIRPYHQSLHNRVSSARRYTVNFVAIYSKNSSRQKDYALVMLHKIPREENFTTSGGKIFCMKVVTKLAHIKIKCVILYRSSCFLSHSFFSCSTYPLKLGCYYSVGSGYL